jgi:mono/diheme cytochrome c family protein
MTTGQRRGDTSKSFGRVARVSDLGRKFIWSLCAAVLLFPSAVFLARARQAQRPQPPLVGPFARLAAQAVFNRHCASCHQNGNARPDDA